MKRTRHCSWFPAGLLVASVASLVACGVAGGLFDPAGRLLEEGRTALERRELDAAYGRFAEIRKRYPASPESREAFPLAAAILQYRYHRLRYQEPESPWLRSEPGFLFDWFDSFLAEPGFPQAEAEALFVGMPYGLFREYRARQQLDSGAAPPRFEVEDDNGIIEQVIADVPAPLHGAF
jgi:hypothetical protein